jgi:hypothetical protein
MGWRNTPPPRGPWKPLQRLVFRAASLPRLPFYLPFRGSNCSRICPVEPGLKALPSPKPVRGSHAACRLCPSVPQAKVTRSVARSPRSLTTHGEHLSFYRAARFG